MQNAEKCELFYNSDETVCSARKYDQTDIDFLLNYFSGRIDISFLEENERNLLELSSGIFDTVVHARLSELPIENETKVFINKVLTASQTVTNFNNPDEKRRAAQIAAQYAANDRTDSDTLVIMKASGKVYHEIHRMMGLLRFTPVSGIFTTKCAPDHFIIPALGEYFYARFGDTPWSIIDEKRGISLLCINKGRPKIFIQGQLSSGVADNNDEWEELWKHYHKTINNEDRRNPELQKQFMPKRYWKYLPEV